MTDTVTFALTALLSNVNSSQVEWSGSTGIICNAGCSIVEAQYPANMTNPTANLLAGLTGMQAIALLSDNPLKVVISSSSDNTITELNNTCLAVLATALTSFTVQNVGSVMANVRLIIVT